MKAAENAAGGAVGLFAAGGLLLTLILVPFAALVLIGMATPASTLVQILL